MRHLLFWPLLVPLLAAGSPATAAIASLDDGPGASLVFPYVEVDLGEADGRSTTFSIGNMSQEPLLAHAVLWSDWGVPVYAWDLHLEAQALQSYNLRDLVGRGLLPATGQSVYLPAGHCPRPIATPALGPEALAELQRQLTGRPDSGGNCASEPRAGRLATGSITVDVVRDCSHGGIDDPRDDGYFRASPPDLPLAHSREALWGDFYLIDPAESSAEGYEAVALGIERDASRVSFWSPGESSPLRREAPGSCSRLRFLRGGPFAARTTLLFFAQRLGRLEALAPCGAAPAERFYYDAYSEAGEPSLAGQELPLGRRLAARLEVGSEIPTELAAGFLQLYAGDGATPIFLAGTIEARGRFAVGTKGLAVETACRLPDNVLGAQP